MNPLKKMYCRTFQTGLKIALPFLPYRKPKPLAQFHSRSFKKPSPYGVTLIMSPWNYPFMLTLSPLADALAAGNTAVVKPSAYSPYTSEIIMKILSQCFDPQYVAVVTGGRTENTCLLREHFDYIFFTGSQAVGKEVMRNAAEHLTPVTLELGGKSPCIVDQSANIRLAARRIVFGKYLNCGQTCVAPDYIYCHRSVKDALVKEIKHQIQIQYGREPLHNPDYGKIINEKHFDRILGLIEERKTVHGGNSDRKALRIEPTVLDNVTFSDPVMQEEIFGPVMPILVFDSLEEVIDRINTMPHPLALYFFTSDKAAAVSTTQSFIWLLRKWASADLVKAAWALITEKPDLIPFRIIRVLWIRRHGLTFPCGISLIGKCMRKW